MNTNSTLTPASLRKPVTRLFEIASKKVRQLDRSWDTAKGTPVFTAAGKYTSKVTIAINSSAAGSKKREVSATAAAG